MSFVPDEPAVMEVCSRGGKLFFNMSTQVTAGNQFEKSSRNLQNWFSITEEKAAQVPVLVGRDGKGLWE